MLRYDSIVIKALFSICIHYLVQIMWKSEFNVNAGKSPRYPPISSSLEVYRFLDNDKNKFKEKEISSGSNLKQV